VIRFDIISANPAIVENVKTTGLIGRAAKKGYIEVNVHHLRDYAEGNYRQIDDVPYGGGAGMVLKPEPFFKCLDEILNERKYDDVINFSPQGKVLNQKMINDFTLKSNLILICGHYKGIDQRVIDKYATIDISLGDFVLSSGDIAAIAFIDAVSRLIPGVLGDGESAMTDSFQNDVIFDAPCYTRPDEYKGMKVPEVLLGGNHSEIKKWKEMKGIEKFLKSKNKNN
jgi:tRNA (guanine37-N1)-methyltransferase